MTKEQKIELGHEILENMDLTKEQYLEMCRMIDELGLEKKQEGEDIDPEDMSWDDLLGQITNN